MAAPFSICHQPSAISHGVVYHQVIVASALESPFDVSLSRDPAFDRGRDARPAARRSPGRVRYAGHGVLEAGVQVRPPEMARIGRGRRRPDAGILPARLREGLLRQLRSVAGPFPHVPSHLSRRLRRERAQGRRAPQARRRRHADPDRLRRSGARAPAAGDQSRSTTSMRTSGASGCAACSRARPAGCARRARRGDRRDRFAVFEQYDLAPDDRDRPTYADLARRLRPVADRRHQRARGGAT